MTLNSELVPNRIFVGNLPLNTTDAELLEYFGKLANHVKDAKIITDPKGLSRGYGFITFENETEASKVLSLTADFLIFKETKLNVANAYKRKQYFNFSSYGSNSASTISNNNYSQPINSCNVQVNNIAAERLYMSPDNGNPLNFMTPTPPSPFYQNPNENKIINTNNINGKSPTETILNNTDKTDSTLKSQNETTTNENIAENKDTTNQVDKKHDQLSVVNDRSTDEITNTNNMQSDDIETASNEQNDEATYLANVQQDNNNNTMPVKTFNNKLSQNYNNEIKNENIDSSVSINPVNDTNVKHTVFNRKEHKQNLRNFHNNNNNYRSFHQFNTNNQHQNNSNAGNNQISTQLTVHTPNSSHLNNLQSNPHTTQSQQFVNGQSLHQYYFAVAAAMAAGINSPVQLQSQQMNNTKQLQYTNNNTGYRNNKNNKNHSNIPNSNLTNNEQNQCNSFANNNNNSTYYYGQQNQHIRSGQAASLKSQSSTSSSSSSAPFSSSSSSNSTSSSSSSTTTSSSSNQTSSSNNSASTAPNSSNATSTNPTGSSNLNNNTSNIPVNNQVNEHCIPNTQYVPTTPYVDYFATASNAPVQNSNYAGLARNNQPISAAPPPPPPLQNSQSASQKTIQPIITNQQVPLIQNQNSQLPYTIYPNYFYLNPNIKPPMNAPNGLMNDFGMNNNANNQSGTSSTPNTSVVPINAYPRPQAPQQAPVSLTFQSNQAPLAQNSYHQQYQQQQSGQFTPVYFAPPPIMPQPQKNTNENTNNNSQQSNYMNSTITNAFETATNSNKNTDNTSSNLNMNSNSNPVGQSSSADNLDEMMRKNLNLQQQLNEYTNPINNNYNQYNNNQQYPPQTFFYLSAAAGSQPNAYSSIAMPNNSNNAAPMPVIHHMGAPSQYYYYYAPNSAPVQHGALAHQNQLQPAVIPQIPSSNNSQLQGGNLQTVNGGFVPISQNTQLHSYPIQINTMTNGGNPISMPGQHSNSLVQSQQSQHSISFLTPHANYSSQPINQAYSNASQTQSQTPITTSVPLLQLPSLTYLNQAQQPLQQINQSPKQHLIQNQQISGQYSQPQKYQMHSTTAINQNGPNLPKHSQAINKLENAGSHLNRTQNQIFHNQQMQQNPTKQNNNKLGLTNNNLTNNNSSNKTYNNNNNNNNNNNRYNTNKSQYYKSYGNKAYTPNLNASSISNNQATSISNETNKPEAKVESDAK